MSDTYTHDVAKTAPRSDITRCPVCGAQLMANCGTLAEYTCGGIFRRRTGEVERHCPNGERPSDLIHDGRGLRARGGLVYFGL